jgi:peptide deformylase
MSVLSIVTYPDKRLRLKSRPVENFNDKIYKLIDDMIDTMYENQGLGLSAIQVGEPVRLFIIDWNQRETGAQDKDKVLVFINPVIKDLEEKTVMENEGCLSLPGIRADVERFNRCEVEAFDKNNKKFSMKAEGLLAIAVQHENDHLDGILYIDRISRFKRNFLLKKYSKLQKRG